MDTKAWIVLITAMSIQTFSSGVTYTYGLFSPNIFMEAFNITESTAVIPATVFYVVRGVGKRRPFFLHCLNTYAMGLSKSYVYRRQIVTYIVFIRHNLQSSFTMLCCSHTKAKMLANVLTNENI